MAIRYFYRVLTFRKIFLLLVFVCCFQLQGRAQILNIDEVDTSGYLKKPQFDLSFNSGVEVDQQKATLVDATNTLTTTLQKYKEFFILSASERFTYQGPQTFLDAGYVHLRFRHLYKNAVHPETYVQYQWDNNRGLKHRFVTGTNIRYDFLKKPKLQLTVATGLMYENERWNYVGVADSSEIPANADDQITHLLKSSTYFKAEWEPSATNQVSLSVFLQERPDKFFVYPRIAHTLHWVIAVGKHVSVDFAYYGIYDPKPVVPIDKYYYSFTNSLLVKI